VGVLVLVVVLSWCLGAFSQQSVAGVQGLPRQVGLLPAVRPGLVGVDATEHLVPSCSVHHDVLPCRGCRSTFSCAFWAAITARCRSSRSCAPFATTRLRVAE
jgi:hypothetical protein